MHREGFWRASQLAQLKDMNRNVHASCIAQQLFDLDPLEVVQGGTHAAVCVPLAKLTRTGCPRLLVLLLQPVHATWAHVRDSAPLVLLLPPA